MNMKKNIILTTIIIILIISINTTYAQTQENITDTPTTNKITTNTQSNTNNLEPKTEIQENNEPKTEINKLKKTLKNNSSDNTTIKNVSSYKELINHINQAKISQTKEYIINMHPGDYNITTPILWGEIEGNTKILQINGQNNTINGNNLKNFIKTNINTTLILNNITITNTTDNYGSIIHNSGNLTINNSILSNSKSTSNTTGGVIFNTGNINIQNTYITNNTAILGILYNHKNNDTSEITIRNTYFTNNKATIGGSIYNINTTKLEIIDSNFINNTAHDSIIYIQTEHESLINNTLLSNNTVYENLITSKATLTINNTKIYNNTQKNMLNTDNTILSHSTIEKNIINTISTNKNNLQLLHNIISHNNMETIIENYQQLILHNNTITYNNITKKGIYNNGSTYIIENIFKNNIIYDKALILSSNINTTVKYSTFYNNKVLDLFIGFENRFIEVNNNKYIKNNLRNTTLNITSIKNPKNPMNITIDGKIILNPIYNTTIKRGNIDIIYENMTIKTLDIINGSFNTDVILNKTKNNTLLFYYNGFDDYSPTNTTYNITIEIPVYEIILDTPKNYTYKDTIQYRIKIKNIGYETGYDLIVNNILPYNLRLINSSSDYNIINNTWHIPKLKSMENTSIIINSISTDKEDINITINIYNFLNNENTTTTKIIKYLEPKYIVDIPEYTNVLLGNIMEYEINITNIGKITGNNITISYILENNNEIINKRIWTINHLNPGEMKKISYIIIIKNHGTYNGIVNITDSYNTTTHKTFNYSVYRAYISLKKILSYPGNIINITANIYNLNLELNATIIFKINKVSIRNHEIKIENNSITLLNYKIKDTFQRRNYDIEIKYHQKTSNIYLYNTTILTLNKYKVKSYIAPLTVKSGKYINITVKLFDENNNKVYGGRAILKINNKTIRYKNGNIIILNVKNSTVTLNNYQIPHTFKKKKYTLDLIYSGSSRYYSNRNSTVLTLIKQELYVSIKTRTSKNIILKGEKTNKPTYNGNIILKINNKIISNTISPTKINTTFILPIINNKNITVCYSGNEVYIPYKYTVDYNQYGKNII